MALQDSELKIKFGTSAELNSVSIEAGSILVCTDTKNVYLDVDTGNRIQLTDSTKMQKFGNVSTSGGITTIDLDTNTLKLANGSSRITLDNVIIDDGVIA